MKPNKTRLNYGALALVLALLPPLAVWRFTAVTAEVRATPTPLARAADSVYPVPRRFFIGPPTQKEARLKMSFFSAYNVTGAGTAGLSAGPFEDLGGTENGAPLFKGPSAGGGYFYYLWFDGSNWNITKEYSSGTLETYYQVAGDTSTVPLSGWSTVFDGTNPAPSLSQYVAPSTRTPGRMIGFLFN